MNIEGRRKYFNIKPEIDINDLMFMHPNALKLLVAFISYANGDGKPATVTSLLDEVEGRATKTHRQGRAFDASVRGWKVSEVEILVNKFNIKYKDIAAISASDLVPRAVVFHKIKDGVFHLHFQVKP